MKKNTRKSGSTPEKAIDRNIEAVQRVRKSVDDNRRADQKAIDRVTQFVGSTLSLYLHFLFYGVWLGFSLFSQNQTHGLGLSIEGISLAASLEAIFLAIFVLINQKHIAAVDRKSSDLHLQMSMLTEHEITRLAHATDLIVKKLRVATQGPSSLEGVKKETDPTELLEKIAEHENKEPPPASPKPL